MAIKIYKLHFKEAHFGLGYLNTSGYNFDASILFSALTLEAIKNNCLEEFIGLAEQDDFYLSDALPYIDEPYLPVPLMSQANMDWTYESLAKEHHEESLKHSLLGIKSEDLDSFIKGGLDLDREASLQADFATTTIQTKKGEDPFEFAVTYFRKPLYVLASQSPLLDQLMQSLQFSGIGGKRSSGYGFFELEIEDLPAEFAEHLNNSKFGHQLLLTTSLPKSLELDQAVEGANYQIVKKAGFVYSETGSELVRKQDLYQFASGSVFKQMYQGSIIDVRPDDFAHPVYSFNKGLFYGFQRYCMTNFYKEYNLKIRTLGPVHIGSSNSYTAKEYIYESHLNENGREINEYYFPDMAKLYVKLNPSQQKSFETFLGQNSKNSRKAVRLVDFLADINFTDRDLDGFKIKSTGYESDQPNKLNEVNQFIRDGRGDAYIPGSSLKGALRTILVNQKFRRDFRLKDPENSIFSDIRVSDSKPIDPKNLIITQKWDAQKNRDPKGLPVFRESIKPWTRIDFTITVTSQEAAELVEGLEGYAKQMYEWYKYYFLNEFDEELIQDNFWAPLYIGAGSGLWTKADHNHFDLELYRKETSNRKTKMKDKGVLKLTKSERANRVMLQNGEKIRIPLIKNDDHFYEMGKCAFKITKNS